MADLLQHLRPPNSQESFHSTRETFDDPSATPDAQYHSSPAASSSHAPAVNQDNTTIAALQAAGLSVHDVNSYLNDPENERLLAETSKRHKGLNNKAKTPSTTTTTAGVEGAPTTTTEPVQLGSPKTSHHISRLNHLCQERGLRPVFDFDEPEPQKFTAVVRFGELVFTTEGKVFESKREAKEAVAAQGMRVLEDVPVPGAGAGVGGGEGENWVGMLAEFYTTTSPTTSPTYISFALGTTNPLYASECTIDEHPASTFGGRNLSFPNKKAAKANAAKEAVLWLRANGYMSSVAGNNKKRKAKVGGMEAIIAEVKNPDKEKSWAAKVTDLCIHLSLQPPTYQLTPSPLAQSMYSGGACFTHDPLIKSPVGEVRNVFGKKNAKEACAERVVEFLMELGRGREGGGGGWSVGGES
ncbi:MAG: hypothetical protein M1830_005065 [Pleopsidium flavum]|nr:MAG: hypothetical protein M1830_005065 [Pleopsidium flavum]